MSIEVSCARCRRRPEAIEEYRSLALEAGTTPDEYVLANEGTLDVESGFFLCDECYVAVGQPSRRYYRWTATPANLAEVGVEVK